LVTGGAFWPSEITKATHCWPTAQVPPQVGYCDGPHVNGASVVVVVVVVDVVTHPLALHASQQLVKLPAHPPALRQRSALRRTAQRGPRAVVRQHVTAPGRPHVVRRAQRMTTRRQRRDKSPWSTRARTTPRAQATYAWCDPALAQSHVVATSARAAAMAASSPGSSPQAARAAGDHDRITNIASPPMIVRIADHSFAVGRRPSASAAACSESASFGSRLIGGVAPTRRAS